MWLRELAASVNQIHLYLALQLQLQPATRIDVFAVRQWPGNAADLDFRGVLEGSTVAIVAAAPVEGRLS